MYLTWSIIEFVDGFKISSILYISVVTQGVEKEVFRDHTPFLKKWLSLIVHSLQAVHG
jgi:hypothetical protein